MEGIKRRLAGLQPAGQPAALLRYLATLNAALFASACVLTIFCVPNRFVFGGVSGLSIVLANFFPGMNVSTFIWIGNLALAALGCWLLGLRAMRGTVYASVMQSFYCSLLEQVFPLHQPITEEPLLELCAAVLGLAITSGVVFNIGASTGGTEVLAMILQKYLGFEIGRALLLSDLGIVLAAAGVFGPTTGLFCILGMAFKCTVVDTAIESLNLRKVCTVISSKPELVRDYILYTLGRAATEQQVTGAYTREDKTAIMVVLTRRQAMQLRNFLRRTDPGAFLTIVSSSEIIGKGFRSI